MTVNFWIKIEKIALWLLVPVVFVLFYLLSSWTPLSSDDFFGWQSISDSWSERLLAVVNWTVASWQQWSGRVVGTFLWSFFMTVPALWIFPIANALVYGLFVWVIHFHIVGEWRKFSPRLFIIINFILWFAVPAWGHDFMWLTGANFYLWTHTALLLLLVPYRYKLTHPDFNFPRWVILPFFLFAIIGGNGVENASMAGLVFLGIYAARKIYRKEKFSVWEIAGALGYLIGFAALAFCPGNAVRIAINTRTEHFHTSGSFVKYGARFIDYTAKLVSRSAWMLGVIAWLLKDLRDTKIKIDFAAISFLIAGFAAVYVMLASPHFPDRAYFPTVIFFTIALLILVRQVDLPAIITRHLSLLTVAMVIVFGASYYEALKDVHRVHRVEARRVKYIDEQKCAGIRDIVITETLPVAVNNHSGYWQGQDIPVTDDQGIARFYGVDTIRRAPHCD